MLVRLVTPKYKVKGWRYGSPQLIVYMQLFLFWFFDDWKANHETWTIEPTNGKKIKIF